MICKADLIKTIAEEENFKPRDVEKIINRAISIITQKVSEGERVGIKNFGTFVAKNRAERGCTNPRTGQRMIVEARRVPTFRAGKEFKSIVSR